MVPVRVVWFARCGFRLLLTALGCVGVGMVVLCLLVVGLVALCCLGFGVCAAFVI